MVLRDLSTMSFDSIGDTLRLTANPHSGMQPLPQLEQPRVGRKSRPFSDQRCASLIRSTKRCSIECDSSVFFYCFHYLSFFLITCGENDIHRVPFQIIKSNM
jgi:hypothetical protein